MQISNIERTKEFLKIREIVNEVDPIGIIYGEENKDEYDNEVKQIMEIFQRIKDEDKLTTEVHNIFIKSFNKNIALKEEPYVKIVRKIIDSFKE
jgi:hypothetical protein